MGRPKPIDIHETRSEQARREALTALRSCVATLEAPATLRDGVIDMDALHSALEAHATAQERMVRLMMLALDRAHSDAERSTREEQIAAQVLDGIPAR